MYVRIFFIMHEPYVYRLRMPLTMLSINCYYSFTYFLSSLFLFTSFFTDILLYLYEKTVVAMHCYLYCALVHVAELPTVENQNSKTWPTI